MNDDKIIQKLVEHDEKLNSLEDKVFTIKDDTRDIKETLEKVVTIINRLDQERIFTTEWVKRIEKSVESHEQELIDQKQQITKMKQALNVV